MAPDEAMMCHAPNDRPKTARSRLMLAALSIVLSAASVHPQTVLPRITLESGEKFFRLDGRPLVMLGTNPTGWDQGGSRRLEHFQELLGWASVNERIVRVHVTNGKVPRPARAGELDTEWVTFWDDVFTLAEQNGVYVLPVFDVWAGWSTRSSSTQAWATNIYNRNSTDPGCANGTLVCGPAVNPVELLDDTPTRTLWLAWMRQLVDHWKSRPNIVGWEIFSELDLIDFPAGLTSEQKAEKGAAFVEAAAPIIYQIDPSRPITASLSGVTDWPRLSTSSAIDFIQIHPYAEVSPYNGNLDEMILARVRERLTMYGKPIFIGESGLDSRAPVTSNTRALSPNATVGINHAIWAEAMSGAMTARMLWFEDGYDRYHFFPAGQTTTRLDLRTKYKDASAPVARFLASVDYSGFQPIRATFSSGVTGAALGSESLIVGWVRDKLSAASANWPATPGWPDTAPLAGQTVTVAAPGRSNEWLVTFYDTSTGTAVDSVSTSQAADGSMIVKLPSFKPSIAFQIRAVSPGVIGGTGRAAHRRSMATGGQ